MLKNRTITLCFALLLGACTITPTEEAAAPAALAADPFPGCKGGDPERRSYDCTDTCGFSGRLPHVYVGGCGPAPDYPANPGEFGSYSFIVGDVAYQHLQACGAKQVGLYRATDTACTRVIAEPGRAFVGKPGQCAARAGCAVAASLGDTLEATVPTGTSAAWLQVDSAQLVNGACPLSCEGT